MHFQVKGSLKNNRNYISKHAPLFLFFQVSKKKFFIL